MEAKNNALKIILITMSIGIWVIVMQNAGIIPTKQSVYVKGGYVKVNGSVDAEVSGSISIDNDVDVNIKAINGHKNAFYDHSYDGVYNRIPVYTGN